MASNTAPALSADEIDDLIYFTRANQAEELSQTITELATKNNTTEQAILENTFDPENGNSVLHYCSANGLLDLLPKLLTLLQTPASASPSTLINHKNKEGNTALHWAAYNGHLDVTKALVAAGADMWVKNAAGHLPMFEAERADKNEVVQYLLEAGGKEVERAGAEGTAAQDDVEDIQEGFTMSAGSAIPEGKEKKDVDMEEA